MITKELCFYVSVEISDNGDTRFLLRTNQSNFIYQFPWGVTILDEEDKEYVGFYILFGEKVRNVLHSTEIKNADLITYKVFYNDENKSFGKLVKNLGDDKGIYYRSKEYSDEIPVPQEGIMFFRQLFRKLMN